MKSEGTGIFFRRGVCGGWNPEMLFENVIMEEIKERSRAD